MLIKHFGIFFVYFDTLVPFPPHNIIASYLDINIVSIVILI